MFALLLLVVVLLFFFQKKHNVYNPEKTWQFTNTHAHSINTHTECIRCVLVYNVYTFATIHNQNSKNFLFRLHSSQLHPVLRHFATPIADICECVVCVRWVFFLCAPRIASIDSQLCKLLLWTESKSFRRWNTCRMSTGEKKHSHKAVDCVFVLFFTFFPTLFSVYIRKNIMYKSSNSNSNGRGKKREKNVARDVVFQAAGCSIHC